MITSATTAVTRIGVTRRRSGRDAGAGAASGSASRRRRSASARSSGCAPRPWAGSAARRRSIGVLMTPPPGLGESLPRAVEAHPHRGRAAAEHPADLRGRQPVPVGEHQDLPRRLGQPVEHLADPFVGGGAAAEQRLPLQRRAEAPITVAASVGVADPVPRDPQQPRARRLGAGLECAPGDAEHVDGDLPSRLPVVDAAHGVREHGAVVLPVERGERMRDRGVAHLLRRTHTLHVAGSGRFLTAPLCSRFWTPHRDVGVQKREQSGQWTEKPPSM